MQLLCNETSKEALELLVHSCLHELLEKPFALTDTTSRARDVVYCFVACRHFREDLTFDSPEGVTSSVAGLMHIFRCTFIRICTDASYSNESCVCLADEILHGNGSFTRLQEVIAKGYMYSTKKRSSARVLWADHVEYKVMAINGKLLSLDNLSAGLKKCFTVCEQLLDKLLIDMIMPTQLPRLDQHIDDLDKRNVGGSFLWDRDFKDYLLIFILSQDHLRSRFVSSIDKDTGLITYNRTALTQYHRLADQLMHAVLFGLHVCYGMPARAEEAVRWRITDGQSIRNVFVIDKTICIIGRYNKTTSITRQEKMLPRYLVPRLAEVLIKLLCIVRPFLASTASQVYQDCSGDVFHDMLFVTRGTAMNAHQFRDSFATSMSEFCGSNVSFSEYRHATEEFVDKHFFSVATQVESNFAVQRGHSHEIAASMYGLTNEDHQHVSAKLMDLMWHCSSKWHSLLGLSQSPKSRMVVLKDSPLPVVGLTKTEHIPVQAPVQAVVHNTISAVTNLGQETVLPESSVIADAAFMNEGLDDQSYEDVEPVIACSNIGTIQLKVSLIETGSDNVELLQSELKAFYCSPQATFKSPEQLKAALGVYEMTGDLAVILSCGGGKTLLYSLVPFMEKSMTTIVVIPCVALFQTVAERLRTLPLRVSCWVPGKLCEPSCQVLLVPIGTTTTDAYQSLCISLHSTGTLKRIVIEEAQCYLTETFRNHMRDPFRLRPVAVPLLFLSGTLPPSMEPELFDLFFSKPVVLRSSCDIANLSYSLQAMAYDDLVQRAVVLATKDVGGRVIVYCKSVDMCDTIAKTVKNVEVC